MVKKPYVEKYKPRRLDDLVLDDGQRSMFRSYIEQRNISNLLLVGEPGLGKTSLANVLVEELGSMSLYVNASVETGVDNIRYKVREFCSMSAMDDVCKIVVLDEADALSSSATGGSSAQSALRNVIEENLADTRFILTGNHLNKILDAIRSRCTPVHLKTSPKAILAHCRNIMSKEGTKASKEAMVSFFNEVVKKLYPDIRSIINTLEHWSVSGSLVPADLVFSAPARQLAADLLGMASAKSQLADMRRMWLDREPDFAGNYQALAGEMFDQLMGQDEKQLIVVEALKWMTQVYDQEVQFAGMMLQLAGVQGGAACS